MTSKETSACSPASRLVFACSGAADVGEISDKAAPSYRRDGHGKGQISRHRTVRN